MLYDHQADVLGIPFKLAGAIFGGYTESSAVYRCFELLKDHKSNPPNCSHQQHRREHLRVRGWLVQVRVLR